MKMLFGGTKEDKVRERLKKIDEALVAIKDELSKNVRPDEKRDLERIRQKLEEELLEIELELEELKGQNEQNYVKMPKDCFLNNEKGYSLIGIGSDGRKYWKDSKGRYYSWDNLHGEVEWFSKQKEHIDALDPKSRLRKGRQDKTKKVKLRS